MLESTLHMNEASAIYFTLKMDLFVKQALDNKENE